MPKPHFDNFQSIFPILANNPNCNIKERSERRYLGDIMEYTLKSKRTKNQPNNPECALANQSDLNEHMRAILVDWLVDVHRKFKMCPETLHLAMNLVDRVTCLKQISKKFYQLVGITSLLIASKYEDIYPPSLTEFTYVCDKAYVEKDLLNMEGEVLQLLKFELVTDSSFFYLEMWAD
jgi:hypothetical protein